MLFLLVCFLGALRVVLTLAVLWLRVVELLEERAQALVDAFQRLAVLATHFLPGLFYGLPGLNGLGNALPASENTGDNLAELLKALAHLGLVGLVEVSARDGVVFI